MRGTGSRLQRQQHSGLGQCINTFSGFVRGSVQSLPSPAGTTHLWSQSSRFLSPLWSCSQTFSQLRCGPTHPQHKATSTTLPTPVTEHWLRCYWQLFSKSEQNPKTNIMQGKILPRTFQSPKSCQILLYSLSWHRRDSKPGYIYTSY